MGWVILVFYVLISTLYSYSDKTSFLYVGTKRDRFEESYLAMLLKWKPAFKVASVFEYDPHQPSE